MELPGQLEGSDKVEYDADEDESARKPRAPDQLTENKTEREERETHPHQPGRHLCHTPSVTTAVYNGFHEDRAVRAGIITDFVDTHDTCFCVFTV